MQNESIIEVTEEALLPADAYNNCCNFLIGKEDAESRD